MRVTVELPDDLTGPVSEAANLSHELVQSFALERYRSGQLSRFQVGQLLQLDYWKTNDLLTRHNAQRPYTLTDLEIDRSSLGSLH